MIDILKLIVKASNDAVFIADVKTGIITYVNDASLRLMGYSLEEIIGIHQTKLHPEEELAYIAAKFEEFTSSNNFHQTNAHVLSKKGEKIPVLITSADLFESEGRTYAAAYFKDMRPYKRLEEIAFLQSHIVRAPVATALGLLNILEDDRNQDEDLKKEVIKYLKTVLLDLDNVIRNVVKKTEMV